MRLILIGTVLNYDTAIISYLCNFTKKQKMSLVEALEERSESKCELCNSTEQLEAYIVAPKTGDKIEEQVAACSICRAQFEDLGKLNPDHWRCLNESMWSPTPAVQVMAYRILSKLEQPWAADLKGQMYMDEETAEWAEQGGDTALIHKDSNGHILQAGDTVTLIQDLNVKGGGFTAKRGTAVRRIRLVHDNAEHIEGKVDGQQIVILTKYVKKS